MKPPTLDVTFAALADPTRRAIVERLALGATHVGELAQPFAISAPAISRHLRVLEAAGLIEREVDARYRICRLRPAALGAAHGWLDQYRRHWEQSLDRLAELLESPSAGATRPQPRRRSPTAGARKAPRRRR